MTKTSTPAPMTGQICTCHRDVTKVVGGLRYCILCQLRKP